MYQKPQPAPSVFESGIEDRPLEEGEKAKAKAKAGGNGGSDTDSNDSGQANQDQHQLRDGEQNSRKNGSRKRNSRRGKQRNAAIQEKYSDKVAENQDIDQILNQKVELSYRLEENKQVLEKLFRVPENKDAVFRSLSIGTEPPAQAMLVFIDGITNAQVQNLAVLQPLMLLSGARDIRQNRKGDTPAEAGVFLQGQECPRLGADSGGGEPVNKETSPFLDFFDRVKQAVLPNNQVAEGRTYDQVVYDVLNGNSALFIEGYNQALLLETKGWHFRSVSPPQVEAVIRGPQEGFTEMLRVNTTLVRKIIHRPSLVTEFVKVGDAAPMQCAVMYMADIANPDLVKEVKRRLESIRADYAHQAGLVEQMIEDNPLHMVPQVLTTERPDRVASNVLEGKVAVLVGGNPFVMIMPCTFFNLMQSPEDAYVRWPFGAFMRLIRYAGLFLALLLPAHYVAIVAYHQEFIPTDLLMAITGAREKVPFPSIVEVLIMEAAFELIREAGVRIPGTIGTTLGIVGALILGQAAVAANIVSPILIIVVAVTALGSFAIPNYSFSLSIRLLRFVYILLASLSGLLGILVGVFIHVGVMSTVKSFGVPFLAPAAPVTRKGRDYFLRGPVWQQETRPDYLDPLKTKRQPQISRGWLNGGDGKGGKERL
ncbi:MAG: spore gernimation protein [Desulfotomaculum sp. BICA1-6]|nr:MAG: spore gernimation protein [Peptococcaceae bacterium BRH_c8a]KJS72483.1 MAG: spore gernimation protein [Desulfotomaculum sp. BICA1-6]